MKIITILLLVAFGITIIGRADAVSNVLSPAVSLSACILILLSKDTQGHYRKISMCYAIGIGIWFVADLSRVIYLYLLPEHTGLGTFSTTLFLIPNCFFALGLIFFAMSEYNFLHFQRMILSTFAAAFFTFLLVQKLFLFRVGTNSLAGATMFGTVLYFFVVVFTIVLVLIIFYQTKFTGHTVGTNFSAVFLVLYNLCEMRMIYFRMIGRNPQNTYIFAFYILSLVVYALAQSDPQLIYRKPEPDDMDAGNKMKKRTPWIVATVLLAVGILLYILRFLDSRDLYFGLIAVLAYVVVYKTIQANELSAHLLYRQKQENERLERLVEEKTGELQKMNAYLKKISITDPLTGLYNRRYGMEKIQELASREPAVPFAVFQLDLNFFKEINDTHGHDAGDLVLKKVARRLQHMMPERVTAIRMGGDEFMLILEETESMDQITRVADQLCRWMDEPITTPCCSYQISASIGIACWPIFHGDVNDLCKYADQAMYEIKHTTKKSRYLIWNR